MLRYLILSLTLVPLVASADIYRCEGPDGHVTFSQAACPDGAALTGVRQVAPAPAPSVSSQEIVRRSNAAVNIMRSGRGGGGGLTIIEDSGKAERARRKQEIAGYPEVPRSQRRHASEVPQGAIDVTTGQYLPGVPNGVIDPRTGTFYHKVPNGYINTRTSKFSPSF